MLKHGIKALLLGIAVSLRVYPKQSTNFLRAGHHGGYDEQNPGCIMSTKCMKIKLRDGSLPIVEAWQEKLNLHGSDVIETLRSEGVCFEAVFLDQQADGDYLIYVMRSDDFDRVSRMAGQSASHIDHFHRAFKESCWEERALLRPLIDFAVSGVFAQR